MVNIIKNAEIESPKINEIELVRDIFAYFDNFSISGCKKYDKTNEITNGANIDLIKYIKKNSAKPAIAPIITLSRIFILTPSQLEPHKNSHL